MTPGRCGILAETANIRLFTEDAIMDEILTAISTVGFPIAMSLLLFWYMTEQNKSHKEETNSLKDAINDLKLAITTLVNKLED